jgi:mono/diheme cytochrome c family protein/peroxiredoxin
MLTILVIAVAAGRWLRIRSSHVADARVAGESRATLPTPRVDRGEIVFLIHCAKCHGSEGHGDPDAIAVQRPPPRDFALRPWRFEVTLDAIRETTLNGIPTTAMPAHREALSPSDLEAVVAHTYRLATAGSVVESSDSPLDAALMKAGFSPEPTPRVAPDLALVDADGNRRSLEDDRGRIVVLHFWGMTCEHCLTGMPKLQQMADRWHDQGLTVLNISADADSASAARDLVRRVSPATHVWIDATGLANAQFEVQVFPTIWLVDRSGRLIGCARGMRNWQSAGMQELLSLLLSRKAAEAGPSGSGCF